MRIFSGVCLAAMLTIGANMASAADDGSCPCVLRITVTSAADELTHLFPSPFILLPACTAKHMSSGAAVAIKGLSKTTAVLTGPFTQGEEIELSCVLTNRRH